MCAVFVAPSYAGPASEKESIQAELIKYESTHGYLLGVVELYYAAGDPPVREILNGLPVECAGRLSELKKAKSKRLRLSNIHSLSPKERTEVSIDVEFKDGVSRKYTEVDWYKMRGKIEYRLESGVWTPVLVVNDFIRTKDPQASSQNP